MVQTEIDGETTVVLAFRGTDDLLTASLFGEATTASGTASYYDVEVEGQVAQGAAWYYPDPSRKAKQIKDHVAFWRGVRVEN